MNKIVLCVGQCVLDIIHVCFDYPKEDSDIRSHHGRWQRGGNASNNCTVLRNLGCSCELLTTFSTAEMFKFVLIDLEKRKIQIKNCVYHDDCEVPISTVLISQRSGSRTIIHSNPNLPGIAFADFDKCDLNRYKWIHFEARIPGETSLMMRKVVERNEENNPENRILISLDLEKIGNDNLTLVNYADYVFVGKDFAEYLGCTNKKEGCYKLKSLVTNDSTAVICPWSSDGAAALDSNNQYFESDAFPPTKVNDTLGAGDTFCAATIYALCNGKELGESIQFGCEIAGAKTGFFGYDQIKDYI